MNRASSATGWVRNPVMKSSELDPTQASSYELGWTYNPITGCLNHINGLCKGGGFPCYAYKLANGRLKQRYLANKHTATDRYDEDSYPFYPHFWEGRLKDTERGYHYTDWSGAREFGAAPKGIFVCDMSDLFGIGIPEEWTRKVLRVIEHTSYNRYYLLSKQAQSQIPPFTPELRRSEDGNGLTQVKVKDKVQVKEEVKEEVTPLNPPTGSLFDPLTEKTLKDYEDTIVLPGTLLSAEMKAELLQACQTFSPAVVSEAIKEAVKQNQKTWRYIRGILNNWQRDNKGEMGTETQ